VTGYAAGFEKEVDAEGEFRGARVRADEVIERRSSPVRLGAVRVCPVVQEPLEGDRIHRLASREEDRKIAVPLGVHVRAARNKKLHHCDAVAVERSPHQRPVAALVHVRSILDHPLRHGPSRSRNHITLSPANTGGRLIKHARYYWLLLAEIHLTRRLFGSMVRRIDALPAPAGWGSAAKGKQTGRRREGCLINRLK
jgi:hypothetical protein